MATTLDRGLLGLRGYIQGFGYGATGLSWPPLWTGLTWATWLHTGLGLWATLDRGLLGLMLHQFGLPVGISASHRIGPTASKNASKWPKMLFEITFT